MREKCLAQEHNAVPGPGLERGPSDPESIAVTIRPPRLPPHYNNVFPQLRKQQIRVQNDIINTLS